MAIKREHRSEQQAILQMSATPEEYFNKVKEAKEDGADWAKDIPCDSIVYFHKMGKIEKVRFLINQQKEKLLK